NVAHKVRKFVRRHRGVVLAGSLLAVVLVIATTVSVGFGLRESAARRREVKARKRAESIKDFVTQSLRSSDPHYGGKQDTTIAEAMANAIREIETGNFKDDPEVEAELKLTIGNILLDNGKPTQAEPLLRAALETRRRLFQGDHPHVAT